MHSVRKREREGGGEAMWEQPRSFTAPAAGSTCATSDLQDVSVKSASQVAAECVCICLCRRVHVRMKELC